MMADLQALPPNVVLDPFWDMAPDGIALPVWLGVIIVLILALVLYNLWNVYKFLVMRPVQGHGVAARAGNEKTQQVLMFGLNRAFSIQALDYLEKVLSFKDKTRIARWLQTSPNAVGMLGNKSIMLASEIFDHPKDPVAELAIVAACRKHNDEATDMEDLITDYESYRSHRDVLEHENPDGVQIPSWVMYDPSKIHQYTPRNRTAGQFGGTILKDANDLNMASTQKTFWEKHIQLFVCLIFAIIMVVITAWFVMNGVPNVQAPALPASVPIPGAL